MTEEKKKLAIICTRGLDDERATVAFTMANGAVSTGLDVTMFMVSSGADLIRVGAADNVRMNPLDPPLKELIQNFQNAGGKIWCCPPCAKVRGYDQEDLIEGVEFAGSVALAGLIAEGAATISL